jgi:non-ribosomal peptide synthetase component E (peptide arylation enzyme)
VMGEKVCVCVAPQDGHTLALHDIVQYLRAEKHVAAFKLPEYLLSMPMLPRNPVGKILKTELRAQAKARHAAPERDAT